MELGLAEDVVNDIWSFITVVDAMECTARSLNRKCGDTETLAIWWYGRDTGRNAETDVAESAQLLHYIIDLLRALPLRIKGRFSVVEDDQHYLGG